MIFASEGCACLAFAFFSGQHPLDERVVDVGEVENRGEQIKAFPSECTAHADT